MGEGALPLLRVGRYAVHQAFGRGGMASVHLGRLEGEAGFARVVAVKRLHAHLLEDPEFAASFIDEARLCSRIRHPNVVPTLDVIRSGNELCLVMEYVEGLSLAYLVRASSEPLSVAVAVAIAMGVLRGLHAAHEACSDHGVPLGIVHRDMSPHNVLVGIDGVARVIDFGVAKAVGYGATTETGHVKGKLPYMSPEQVSGEPIDRRTDVFAAGAVLWEALTRKRLFAGDSPADIVRQVMERTVPPPSDLAPAVSPALDAVVLKALARDPAQRYATAAEMEAALEAAGPVAPPRIVGSFVQVVGAAELSRRAAMLRDVESASCPVELPQDALESIVAPIPAYSATEPFDVGTGSRSVLVPTSSSLANMPPLAQQRRRVLIGLGAGIVSTAMLAAFAATRFAPSPSAPNGAAPIVDANTTPGDVAVGFVTPALSSPGVATAPSATQPTLTASASARAPERGAPRPPDRRPVLKAPRTVSSVPSPSSLYSRE
ncbi:MAG: protein kinase [Myxococcales bacterium]|nr:protein kinase [Myxococcales bacterium]